MCRKLEHSEYIGKPSVRTQALMTAVIMLRMSVLAYNVTHFQARKRFAKERVGPSY